MLFGDLLLAALDGLIEELDDLTAIQAHHMIMVFFLGNFEDRMSAIEIVPHHQSCRLELGQHAVDGGQANIFTRFEQRLVDVFGTQVMLSRCVLENLQYLDARQGHLETGLAQFMVLVGHGRSSQYRVGSGMIDRIHDSEERAQMQKLTGIITLSAVLLLSSGCSYFGVYKRDLTQGNLVTANMVSQLQPGMSRDQVVNVMGRPLLEAPFDANEWDYVFRLDEAYGGVEQRRVTLTFDGDRLVNIERQGNLDSDIELRADNEIGPRTDESAMDAFPATEAAPENEGRIPMGGEPAREP